MWFLQIAVAVAVVGVAAATTTTAAAARLQAPPQVTFVARAGGGVAGGWGDRLKGILTAHALAVALRRPLFIDSSHGWNLHDFYEGDWHPKRRPIHANVLEKDCRHRTCEECFVPWIVADFDSLRFYDDVVYWGNYDCVDRLEMVLRQTMPPASFAYADLFSRPRFRIPKHETAWHVRFGGTYTVGSTTVRNGAQPNDNVVARGNTDVAVVAKAYRECHDRMTQLYFGRVSAPFVALDVDDARVRAAFGLDAVFLNATRGHAEKLANVALATHVEFEILRRARLLLMDVSGFSYMAHKTRRNQHQIAYEGVDCRRPFENRVIDLTP